MFRWTFLFVNYLNLCDSANTPTFQIRNEIFLYDYYARKSERMRRKENDEQARVSEWENGIEIKKKKREWTRNREGVRERGRNRWRKTEWARDHSRTMGNHLKISNSGKIKSPKIIHSMLTDLDTNFYASRHIVGMITIFICNARKFIQ